MKVFFGALILWVSLLCGCSTSPKAMTIRAQSGQEWSALYDGLVESSAYNSIWKDSTGYYWRGARYYDGESGQWLSFDPYGFWASPNPYGYPNDPVNYCDPNGRIGKAVGREAKGFAGWALDTLNDTGNTILGLGAHTVGTGLDILGDATGGDIHLGSGFTAWGGYFYRNMGQFARRGWYNPRSPGAQTLDAATIVFGPESIAGKLGKVERVVQVGEELAPVGCGSFVQAVPESICGESRREVLGENERVGQ